MSAGFVGRQGAKSGSVGFDKEVSPTLRQGITTDVCYCLQGNCIDRNAAQNGSGVSQNIAHTINSIDRHGVAYAADCRNLELNHELSGTLQAKNQGGHSLNYINPVVYPGVGITSKQNASNPTPGDPAPTISTDSRNYLVQTREENNGTI